MATLSPTGVGNGEASGDGRAGRRRVVLLRGSKGEEGPVRVRVRVLLPRVNGRWVRTFVAGLAVYTRPAITTLGAKQSWNNVGRAVQTPRVWFPTFYSSTTT